MEKLLTIKEVSEILQVNERTIHRLLQAGKIPATRVGNQWRFVPDRLEEWLMNGGENGSADNESQPTASAWEKEEEFQVFSAERVCLDLTATSSENAIRQLVQIMVETGHLLQGDVFFQAVMEREKKSATGIGNGVALPHAWHPINDLFRVPLVACARFNPPVDFHSVDGNPVDLAFLLCSPRSHRHLKLLRSLSLLAKDEEILAGLREAKTPGDFIAPILANGIPQFM